MKIVTLNIRHGGGKRVAPILEYLRSQGADVIVLTEFRQNANAPRFRSELTSLGFPHWASAPGLATTNSVCIFATRPFTSRTYLQLSEGDRSRVVSAHFERLAVVGVYFPLNRAKAGLYRFLLGGGLQPIDEAHVVVGDFNTGLHGLDERGRTFHCAEEFAALAESGLSDCWRTRNPGVSEFSWYSSAGNGFRIDHAFASPSADRAVQRTYYDHAPRTSKITDHSALILQLDLPFR